ncbi:hypothetical protein [Telmatospirillum sp. J64-1]|uniref:hypothetical protein n=1 Tax=Telmatospirillum sp. J64-1 TaxID=2502183 RepID=UPI00115F4365|nr:hypothetical protein [Telmatospirillum sp. J64-1]
MTVDYRTDDECEQCLEIKPLLMPVEIEAYGGRIVDHLCFECRVGWQNNQWAMLASTYDHRRKPSPLQTEEANK